MAKISPHFSESEVMCKCGCGYIAVNPILVRLLEKIRDNCGNNPVMVHSWCRCPTHNENVGGVSESQHLYGAAADISISGVNVQALGDIAITCGADGIGYYYTQGFVHVDVRGEKDSWVG